MKELRKSAEKINTMAKSVISDRSKHNLSKNFRIIQDTKLPQLTNRSLDLRKSSSPQKLVEDILKNHQFLYIDLNQQNGCVPMKRDEEETRTSRQLPTSTVVFNEEEQQKIGNYRITDIRYLSEENKQTHEYLHRTKQLNDQRQNIRALFKKQIDNSIKRLSLRKNYRIDYESLQPKKREYNPDKLRRYLEQEQLDQYNNEIWKRQVRLMNKFGIGQNYLPKNVQNKTIEKRIKMRKYRGQGKLPQLNLSTIE